MSTEGNEVPRIIRFAIDPVLLGVTSSFFAKFKATHATLKTTCVPGFPADFHQVAIHDSTFTTGAILAVRLQKDNIHCKFHQHCKIQRQFHI